MSAPVVLESIDPRDVQVLPVVSETSAAGVWARDLLSQLSCPEVHKVRLRTRDMKRWRRLLATPSGPDWDTLAKCQASAHAAQKRRSESARKP